MSIVKTAGSMSVRDPDTGDKAKVKARSDSSFGVATEAELAGSDSLAAYRRVNTKVRSDGLTALVTDATVVVESTFGFDQNPDSFFRIVQTGSAGCEWTVFIAATANDPTSPDRDAPAYSKIFTVTAPEVGDELSFRDRIVQELNADTTFRNTCGLKAQKATDRAIVHIYSENFSASGEFWERPNAGDFNITIGGSPADGVVIIGFDNLISRSKPVTISRDYDSPHRLGLFGITGNVRVEQKDLADLFVAEALNSGSNDMRVNASLASPIDFTIPASAATDLFIEMLIFDGGGNGIKFGQFLSKNTTLANGVEVTIKSDNVTTTFPVIYTTEGFKNKWSALSGDGANFRIDVQAGQDEMLAILKFNNPFIMRVAGSFSTDDFIRVRIRDNLSSQLIRFNFRAKGFEKEP